MKTTLLLVVTLLIAVAVSTGAARDAFACGSMGSDVHAGVVKSVGKTSFALVDAETAESLTFDATPVQLHDLTSGQAIKVKYAIDAGRLKAVRIGK